MKKYIHLVISGHGRVNEKGVYTTAPSKMFKFPDGLVIYEGEENYKIKQALIEKCKESGIKYIDINPESADISLNERVRRVNKYAAEYIAKGFTPVLHEIHLNAFNSKAEGTEVFTTVGQNNSDLVAEEFMKSVIKLLPKQKLRVDMSDGDMDKEKDFFIIKKAITRAALYELFFFDNRKEVDRYCNNEGYGIWADVILDAIKNIEKKQL